MSQYLFCDSDIAALDDTELAEANIKTTSLLNTIQQEIYKRASENKFRTLQDELDEAQKELRNIRVLLGNDSGAESSESSDNHNTPPRDINNKNHPLTSDNHTANNLDFRLSLPNTININNPSSIITSSNATSETRLTPVEKTPTVIAPSHPRTKYSSKRLRKRK